MWFIVKQLAFRWTMENRLKAKPAAIFSMKKNLNNSVFFYFSISRHIRSFINIIDAPLKDSAAATLRAIILSSWLGGRANRWTGFPAHAHRLTGFRWPVTTQRSVVHHPQLGALISNSVCPDPHCNFQFHFEISGLTFVFFFLAASKRLAVSFWANIIGIQAAYWGKNHIHHISHEKRSSYRVARELVFI